MGVGLKLAFQNMDCVNILSTYDIAYCTLIGSECIISTANKEKLYTGWNLKSLECFLCDEKFCRINHSTIVNIDQVKKYHYGLQPIIEMNDGIKFYISRRKKSTFISKISDF